MEKGTRLYINITNRCNTDCPFCCMYSGTGKTIDMKFDVFRRIVDDCDGEFEIQFEGLEVKNHPNRVYEAVFHPNGNLCASWIDKERILDPYRDTISGGVNADMEPGYILKVEK